MKKAFLAMLFFLFFLPFLDGGTSFLGQSLVLALPFLVLIISLISRSLDYRKVHLLPNLFLTLFIFFTAISVIYSVSPWRSLPPFFLLLAIFLWLQLFWLTAGKDNLKWLAYLILSAAFLLSLLNLFYFLPWVPKPTASMTLVWANFGHSHLADYLLLAIPISLAFFLETREEKKERGFFLLLLFYLLMLLLTFSRGAFLILPPVLLFVTLKVKATEDWKKKLGLGLSLTPLLFLLFILFFSFHPLGFKAKEQQPNHWLVRQVVKTKFFVTRFDYWQETWLGFLERPFTGWGWGNFQLAALRWQTGPQRWSAFAHNFYLQVLVEGGIASFLSFSGFLSAALIMCWRRVRKNKEPLLAGVFGAVLASALHSLLDYDWHFPAVFLTFLALLTNLMILAPVPKWNLAERLKKFHLAAFVFLSFLVWFFLMTQLVASYFFLKGDYRKILSFAPWWLISLCQKQEGNFVKERIFLYEQDFPVQQCLKKNEAVFLGPFEDISFYSNLFKNQREKEGLLTFLGEELNRAKRLSDFGSRWGKYFYLWGKEYLDKSESDKTLFWWQKANEVLPEWSYFYLELATLYLEKNDTNKAYQVLESCLKFKYPKEHCQEYLDKLIKGEQFERPGFFQNKILAIPDY